MMTDYIKREDAQAECNKRGAEHIVYAIGLLPSADVVPIADIYDAGCQGKEVRFRIGGRLFAVRELPQ